MYAERIDDLECIKRKPKLHGLTTISKGTSSNLMTPLLYLFFFTEQNR